VRKINCLALLGYNKQIKTIGKIIEESLTNILKAFFLCSAPFSFGNLYLYIGQLKTQICKPISDCMSP
jgi:hypothetical protein